MLSLLMVFLSILEAHYSLELRSLNLKCLLFPRIGLVTEILQTFYRFITPPDIFASFHKNQYVAIVIVIGRGPRI